MGICFTEKKKNKSQKRIFLGTLLVLVCVIAVGCGKSNTPEETTMVTETTEPTVQMTTVPVEETTSAPTTEETTEATTEATTEPETSEPETEPEAMAAESNNEGITFLEWPETAERSEDVTVTIQGQPNTNYAITVYYKSGPSKAAGLDPQTSDDEGYASWTWHVGSKTSQGTFKIEVAGGGEKETVNFSIVG